ncbi:hypothetical protein [Ornatilinea apprima]|uniref:hypothetical protein n=1 Tax=Ornatilinea apprima TaxID=1134406 RepID=UPI00094654A9|nr:hypothetical protein [Ornatilinea apprima]
MDLRSVYLPQIPGHFQARSGTSMMKAASPLFQSAPPNGIQNLCVQKYELGGTGIDYFSIARGAFPVVCNFDFCLRQGGFFTSVGANTLIGGFQADQFTGLPLNLLFRLSPTLPMTCRAIKPCPFNRSFGIARNPPLMSTLVGFRRINSPVYFESAFPPFTHPTDGLQSVRWLRAI